VYFSVTVLTTVGFDDITAKSETADHPPRGDAWVVRRTARCGNVGGADAAIPAAGNSVPCER
jgi:hypothetical protein